MIVGKQEIIAIILIVVVATLVALKKIPTEVLIWLIFALVGYYFKTVEVKLLKK